MTLHASAKSIPNERPTCPKCGVGMWLHCVETVDRWSQKRTYQCQACGGAASIILKIDQGRVTDELARGLVFLVALSRDLYRTVAIIHHDGRMQIFNLRRSTVFAFDELPPFVGVEPVGICTAFPNIDTARSLAVFS